MLAIIQTTYIHSIMRLVSANFVTQLPLHGPVLSIKVSEADEIDMVAGNVAVDSVAVLEAEEEEVVVVEDVGELENQ